MHLIALAWSSTYTRIIYGLLTFLLVGYFIWRGAFTLDNVERSARVADTLGGKIIILVVMTLLFFIAAIGVCYYALDAVQAGSLKSDDTLAVMLVQFVTGAAFGTAMGALVSLLGGKGNGGTK